MTDHANRSECAPCSPEEERLQEQIRLLDDQVKRTERVNARLEELLLRTENRCDVYERHLLALLRAQS